MSQATLDDDELFTEAASEMQADVESSLGEARQALPEPEEIWEVESENTLGVLNALRSALDLDDAREHLRDAKKWFTMGEKADAFDDADALAEDIEEVESLVTEIESAGEEIAELTSTIPQLRSTLEDIERGDESDADPERDLDAETAEA